MYADLSAPEIRERQEFAYEAAIRIRDRFLGQEIWSASASRHAKPRSWSNSSRNCSCFRQMLFAKVVPNCCEARLARRRRQAGEQGWLRQRFAEMGVLGFETLPADDGTDVPDISAC